MHHNVFERGVEGRRGKGGKREEENGHKKGCVQLHVQRKLPTSIPLSLQQTKMFSHLLPMFFLALSVNAACQPMCCDAVVQSISPPGKIAIRCTQGGLDCGFSGQVYACCERLSPVRPRCYLENVVSD